MSRRCQFSLRALLLVLTIFAAMLGTTVDRAHRQRHAVAVILARGGAVRYQHEISSDPNRRFLVPDRFSHDDAPPPPGPAWLRALIGEDYFVTVVGAALSCERRDSEPDCLQCLKDLPQLESLWLHFLDADTERLQHLRALRRLQNLFLFLPQLAADGANGLAELSSLQELQINMPRRGGLAEWGLAEVRQLRRLGVQLLLEPAVDDLEAIASLSCLEELSLVSDRGLKDAELQPLGLLKQLRALKIGSPNVDGRCLQYFRGLGRLERLEVQAPNLSEARLCELNSGLRHIFLYDCSLSDFGLSLLGNLRRLETISHYQGRSSNGVITGEAFDSWKDLCELRQLCLDATQITDSKLAQLGSCPNLKLIVFSSSRVTPSGISALRTSHPGCQIVAHALEISADAFEQAKRLQEQGKEGRE